MLAIVSILLGITIPNVVNSAVEGSWAYDEPGNDASNWPDYYAECGYSRQSPIDIPLDGNSTCSSGEALELKWTSEPSHYAIQNTGSSLKAMPFAINHEGGHDISGLEVLSHANDTNIKLQNSFYHTYESGISKEYCFNSLHFHWGRTNDVGSEHTVNGESFPLEVHLVHYSCDYPQAGDAINDYATGQSNIKYDDINVLAVIGVIFEIGKPNPVIAQILDDMIMDGIYKKSDVGSQLLQLYYTEFDLKGLLPESREIIGYLGSLTTPPCFETVRWHVLKDRMTVSEEQMEKFRALLASDDDDDTQPPNFRPTMPLNDRVIYQCQEDVDDDALFTDIAAKVEYLSEDDVETAVEDDNDSMTETELLWRLLGIAFICLFMVTLAVCMVAVICLCKHRDNVCRKRARKPSELEMQHSESIQHAHNQNAMIGHNGGGSTNYVPDHIKM